MSMPSVSELMIILVIILVLFGAKKIPDLASGIGKGIKNFKNAMKDDEEQKQATNESQKIDNQPIQTTTNIQDSQKA